jgi:lysophospholipase L1-like esterase
MGFLVFSMIIAAQPVLDAQAFSFFNLRSSAVSNALSGILSVQAPDTVSARVYTRPTLSQQSSQINPQKAVYLEWNDRTKNETDFWIMRSFVGTDNNNAGTPGDRSDWVKVGTVAGDESGARETVQFHDMLDNLGAGNQGRTAYYRIRANFSKNSFAWSPIVEARLGAKTSSAAPIVDVPSIRIVRKSDSTVTVGKLFPTTSAQGKNQILYTDKILSTADLQNREIGFWLDVVPENFSGSFRTYITSRTTGQTQRFTENNPRWSLLGNSGLNITPWIAKVGEYEISLTPCSEDNARGICNTPILFSFSISDASAPTTPPNPTPTSTPTTTPTFPPTPTTTPTVPPTPTSTATTTGNQACAAKKIVVLGSSTAQGTGSTGNGAWVKRFTSYVQGKNPNHTVINLAKGSQSTYNVLPTGTVVAADRPAPNEQNNITKALSYSPDGIIVNLPSNDVTGNYTLDEIKANFLTLKSAADAAGVKIWFTTTQPVNTTEAQRVRLAAVRDWIFGRFGDKVLDFWYPVAASDGTILPQYNGGDGLHLNNAGHEQLYNQVVYRRVIEKLCGQ